MRDTDNENVLIFPSAFAGLANTKTSEPEKVLTDSEQEYLMLRSLDSLDQVSNTETDLAYHHAFFDVKNDYIKNLYHKPKLAFDFELPQDIQVDLEKLELQLNKWDYLLRKISLLQKLT